MPTIFVPVEVSEEELMRVVGAGAQPPPAPPAQPPPDDPWAGTNAAPPAHTAPAPPAPQQPAQGAAAPVCVHGPRRYVPAGFSKSTGRAYPAFWGCSAPRGAPDKCATVPA